MLAIRKRQETCSLFLIKVSYTFVINLGVENVTR